METAIIFVFLICLGLWGMSRCKKKKEEAAIQTATEVTAAPLDTSLLSPAAAKTRMKPNPVATNQPLQPLPPQYQQTQVPLPTTPTNTPAVQPNSVPQSYNTTTSPANTRLVPAPQVNTKSVPQTTTTPPPSNTMLYVLINGLNIRAKADLKAKIKGKLKLNEQVYFLEEATEQAQTVRLANGTSVTKPWFKIQTKRGTVGWVHGSGVDFYKRKPTDGL